MFNISEFKSKIHKHGGPGKTNLFIVTFSGVNTPFNIISTEDLRFFCQSVTMPGINLQLSEYRPSGIGYVESMPMGSNPDNLNGVFMLDSSHHVLSFFHNWINSVVNSSSDLGDSTTGLRQHEINYKSAISTDMDIQYYSAYDSNNFYLCSYSGVYPTQIGSIDLNWSENDTIATLPVNFSYNKLKYAGFQSISVEKSRIFRNPVKSKANNKTFNQIITGFSQEDVNGGIL